MKFRRAVRGSRKFWRIHGQADGVPNDPDFRTLITANGALFLTPLSIRFQGGYEMCHIEQSVSGIRVRKGYIVTAWRWADRSASAGNYGAIIADLPSPQTTPISGPNRGYGFPISDPMSELPPRRLKNAPKLRNPYPRLGSEKRAGHFRHR